MDIILDTNVLLSYPTVLDEDDRYILLDAVLKEVDRLKNSKDKERAYEARRASHYLLNNLDKINFIDTTNASYKNFSVDDLLLDYCEPDTLLYTNDINVYIKGKALDKNVFFYNKHEEIYTGVRYLTVELDTYKYNELIDSLLKCEESFLEEYNPKENEFFIISDQNGNEFLQTRYKNGKMTVVDKKAIKNIYTGKILPRNVEQKCLIDLMNDEDISILFAHGGYGTGKSLLMTAYALEQLSNGKIDKIVYVPNNALNKDTMEVGTLPGELYDKEITFMGTLVDMIGEMCVKDLYEKGNLEIAPLATMRGRNFTNSIVLVNEAQNLTEDHVKLLIGRIGEGSKIFFDGDIKQVDSSIFKNKNGLRLLTELRKSDRFSKIFGTVRMSRIERSFTSQAADYLDNIQ